MSKRNTSRFRKKKKLYAWWCYSNQSLNSLLNLIILNKLKLSSFSLSLVQTIHKADVYTKYILLLIIFLFLFHSNILLFELINLRLNLNKNSSYFKSGYNHAKLIDRYKLTVQHIATHFFFHIRRCWNIIDEKWEIHH